MRLIATLFILVLSIASCKKGGSSGEDVDPREQYVGSYNVDYTSRTKIGAIDFNEDSGKGVLTFAKGDAANEMKMTTEFSGYSTQTDVIKISGARFTIDRTRDQMRLGNKTYDAEFSGSGLFEGNNVTVTSITKTNQDGTIAEWTRSYKGLKR